MPEIIDISSQKFSFFAKGSRMSGTFNLTGTTHLASNLEGDLFMEDNSSLVIEPAGVFNGQINCVNLEIYGKVVGTIKSTGKVTLYASAVLNGEVFAEDLVIHPGAVVNITGKTI